MFRLHFAYMSLYQVLEYHMEFLETFGCIWSSKEVFKVIIGRAAHESDQSGATQSSRSDLPIRATLPERQGGVARVFITRRRENESGATSPERHNQVALISLSERPYQSDMEELLAFSSPRDARTSPERPLAATQRGRSRSLERLVGATSRATRRRIIFVLKKTTKNLWKVISLNQLIGFRHLKVAPAGSEVSRATLEVARLKDVGSKNTLGARARVAPAGSDVMGAIPRSRSRFRRNGAQKLTRSDVLERHLEVAPAQSEVSRATLQGRSRFCRITTRGNDSGATSPSDTLTSLPNRSRPNRTTLNLPPTPATPSLSLSPPLTNSQTLSNSPTPKIPKPSQFSPKSTNKGKLEAERQEAESQEFALRGKALACEPTGSGTQRTVRQQTLAARKSKEHEKRAGKSVAVPTHEESETESEDEQAPTKKAKMSKGKGVAVDRDRAKTPSVEELYDHLKNGVTWTPTRFADLDLLKELGLESDIEAMLGHLKMPKLLTMAYPFYKDVTCQFLSSLVVTYHDTAHVRQGWGKIRFKVNGREYNMNFKDIGRVMGFQDLEDHSLPKCENLPTELWKLITGNKHSTGADKNSHIRHPSVRYLHRMLVHAFYPRKQAGTVTEEDMRLLCPAIRPYAQPGVLPLPSTDIYATFGMVSFFVGRLEHYRDWAWYTTDSRPKMGIGGMITPLLQFLNVPLGKDAAGPRFIDGTYLRIATYFSGMYGKDYVYHYYLQGKPVEVVLPNRNLTSLEIPGAVSFNIPQEYFLGEHGPLDPIQAAPSRRRSVPTQPDSPVADTSEHIYGPPRYYFKPHDGVLPPGALRDAHDHIGRLQRWNKAQDRTIEKLKDKCKALSKTVKKQAKTSAKFMKKVADVLTRGGIAGCSSADFAFANTSNPQPPPPPDALGFPLTAAQLQRKWRNPPTQPSTSGNKSPSLASSDSEDEIDEVESQPWYGGSGSASGDFKEKELMLHFAYMSPYQVLEYHMEFLEHLDAFGAQKGVFKVIIGRARHGSDQSGATPPSRSDPLLERPYQSDREKSLAFHHRRRENEPGATSGATQQVAPRATGKVARVFITRRRENEPGATSRSDTARSLPKPGATCRSDGPRSLRVLFLLELMISQGPFGHFIMHPPGGGSSLFLKNHQKPLESDLFESIDHSKLDHPRSNPYIHEFSFPIVKKFKNPSKSLVALRLSDYLHSRCFDIFQNWFDNHLYYNICLRSLENIKS
ncbi:hypothetical protein IGI04_019915 [Brassica rapa subsp. trilocularis]|uniref:Arabidopsis retrotransposon Orf1 C-terminal domain-containing protein n=1 Tax=Brassica rapa subsp. trilocularis TaxID=1813537 RepID=A0ABQ7MH83_BRACM|nr:hypothetical protein IGI04_019915 [Brassica rapa subsp. trilocularis]